MIIETPFYYQQNIEKAEIFACVIDWNIFTACSMTFFSYTCQVQLMPVYSELVNPNYKRISKVINRSMVTDMIFYMVIAGSGYLSTFNSTS
jgi:amino acid permease